MVDWYGTIPYRVKFTVNGANISGNLINFPTLFKFTGNTTISSNAHSGGKDFIFTTSDGVTRTNWENENYLGGSGCVWVKLPTLTDKTSQDFYLYYGGNVDYTQDVGYKASGVWDEYYHGVWHLNEDPSLKGNGVIKDSTKWGFHGSSQTTMRSVDSIIGAFGGKGIQFDGTNDYITIPTTSGLNVGENNFTVELWFWGSGNLSAHQSLFCKGTWNVANEYIFYIINTGGGSVGVARNSDYLSHLYGNNWFTSKKWHYTVAVRNGLDAYLYSSAKQKDYDANFYSGYTFSTSKSLDFGARDNHSQIWFRGRLDEIRYSFTNRTAGWIKTSYSSMAYPLNFITFGEYEQYTAPSEEKQLFISGDGRISIYGSHRLFDTY